MLNKHPLIGNLKQGLLFIVSAPAGTGKTTLVNLLVQEFDRVKVSISYTTRPPRPQERDGIDYHFVTDEVFQEKIEQGEFLEYVTLFGHRYGTSRVKVHEMLMDANHVVLVIDTQGAQKLRNVLSATYIFVMPPSLEVLAERLNARGTETTDVRLKRLKTAESEIEAAKGYDYIIVNDDLSIAYQALRSIIIAEEHSTKYLDYNK